MKMKTNLKNLTGHDLNIVSKNSEGDREVTKTIPSDGIARVSRETIVNDTVNGIDIYETVWGETTGLPLPGEEIHCCMDGECPSCGGYGSFFRKEDTVYIVSKIVAEVNCHRKDLLIVSETVRDGSTILGCKGLARLS